MFVTERSDVVFWRCICEFLPSTESLNSSPQAFGLGATTLQEQPCLLSKLERPDSDCNGGKRIHNGTPFIFTHLCEDLALWQATDVRKPLNSHKSKLDVIDLIRPIYADPWKVWLIFYTTYWNWTTLIQYSSYSRCEVNPWSRAELRIVERKYRVKKELEVKVEKKWT